MNVSTKKGLQFASVQKDKFWKVKTVSKQILVLRTMEGVLMSALMPMENRLVNALKVSIFNRSINFKTLLGEFG